MENLSTAITSNVNMSNVTETENDTLEYDYDIDEAMSTYYLEDIIPTATVYGLTFIIGILGNSLIIFTITRHRRMRTITNVFLASLASADLLLILVCVPAKMAKLLSFTWTLGEVLCKYVHYMQNVSAICSVLTMTSMSLERYYAILHPMKAKYICTISQARKVILVIWILSFLLAIPIIFVQVHVAVGVRYKAFWCVHDWTNYTLWRFYTVYMLFINLIIPACIMAFAYTSICHEVWNVMRLRATMTGGEKMRNGTDPPREMHTLTVETNGSQQNTSSSGSGNSRHRRRPKRSGFIADEDNSTVKQVIKMLVVVVLLFIICWAPLLISEVLTSFGYFETLNYGYLKAMRTAFPVMAYFNSCVNPIVYGFMSRNFRQSFLNALCLCRYGHPLRQMSFTQTRTTSVSLGRTMSVTTHTNNTNY